MILQSFRAARDNNIGGCMKTLVEVLMTRDNISKAEAVRLIRQAHDRLQECLDEGDYEGAENIAQEEFGLEPDCIFEIMEGY